MQILAEKREKLGKQSKKLKAVRKIPAVVYGSGLESTALEIDLINFGKVYKEAGETSLIDLKFNDSNEKVLIKEVQYNPVTLIPLHASFFKVNLKEKIKANIPVHVIGEEESPIIKSKDGLVLVLLNEIEVEALPSDLPHEFTVDVSGLATIGEGIKVSELKFDKGKVELVSAQPDDLIVKIDSALMAEIVEEVPVTEEELVAGVEATEEKVEEEGEEGAVAAEGETKGEKPKEEKPAEKKEEKKE